MAGYVPPPLGPYEYHEVLSALRKEIKLNRPGEAIYWLNVILTYGGASAPKMVSKQMWIMAAEDIDDVDVVLRCGMVYQMMSAGVSETDHLFYLIGQMCSATKWWETQSGRQVDWLWSKAIGDLKVAERNHPIPLYALDRHTRRGWEIFRRTGQFDDRFSGTGLGRAKTEYLFLRDERIDPESMLEVTPAGEPDDRFLQFWMERRNVEALSGKDLEPNDPIGPGGTVPEVGMLFDATEPQVPSEEPEPPRFD